MSLKNLIKSIMAGLAILGMLTFFMRDRVQTYNEVLEEGKVEKNTFNQKEHEPIYQEAIKRVESQSVQLSVPKTKDLAKSPVRKTKGPPELAPGHVLFQIRMKDWAVMHGDILLGKIDAQNPIKEGQFRPQQPRLWPSPEIPYIIDTDYPYKELIEDVIAYFHEKTPIRFVNPQGQSDGIIFKLAEEHCYSYLGRVGGYQPIFLAEECRGPQIIHEILHALGFIHEQSRMDRDKYIEIDWEAIQPGYELQFTIAPPTFMFAIEGSPFDYKSIMLYDSRAFAKDPEVPVMQSTTEKKIEPTQEGLSQIDIERINNIYKR